MRVLKLTQRAMKAYRPKTVKAFDALAEIKRQGLVGDFVRLMNKYYRFGCNLEDVENQLANERDDTFAELGI